MPLTNTQYDTLMRQYQQKQLRNQRLQRQLEQKLYQRIPRLHEIDSQIRQASLDAVKQRLRADPPVSATSQIPDYADMSLEKLHQRIALLRQEKLDLIQASGLSAEEMTIPYDCPDCKDTGYINGERCHCFRQAAIALVYRQSNLSKHFQEETFDQFRLDYYAKDRIDPKSGHSSYELAKDALAKCHSYVDNFGQEGANLILYGSPGLGKTFLTNCIANELISRSYSVIYFSAAQLFDVLRQASVQSRREGSPLGDISYDLEDLLSCDLLIIDDLGTENKTEFSIGKFFEIVNERHLRDRSTVISTNLGLQEIRDSYTDRIFSRMAGQYNFIRLYGADVRIQKNIGK